jgi:predicted aspartyl protease
MRLALKTSIWLTAGVCFLGPAPAWGVDAPADAVSFRLAGGRNPLILVPVYVEGKGPYEFILDTGAFRCLLSQELSAAIGIRPETAQPATGAGGPMKLSSSHVASLAIGTAREDNVEVAITGELSRFGNSIQSKVDGVLGFNFLKDFCLTLDYKRNILRLARPSHEPREENGVSPATSMPFRLAASSKQLILLPVFVNGKGPFQFVLDTGASRTTLSFALARKLGIVAIGDRSGTGGGGQVRILSSTVNSFDVGGASVCDLAVGVGEFLGPLSTAAETKLDGIIGDNFLSLFVVTIDYPRGTLDLSLSPYADLPPHDLVRRSTPPDTVKRGL